MFRFLTLSQKMMGCVARFVKSRPYAAFGVVVVVASITSFVSIQVFHAPYRYQGKTLTEWNKELNNRKVDRRILETWFADEALDYGARRVFADMGDEGVLYLLGHAQIKEPLFYKWMDKLPPKYRGMIPIESPTLPKANQSIAFRKLSGMRSDIFRDPKILSLFQKYALSKENDSVYAAVTWAIHDPSPSKAVNQVLKTYIGDGRAYNLMFFFHELNRYGVEFQVQDDFVNRWLKPDENEQNFLKAISLYQHSPSYIGVVKEGVKALVKTGDTRPLRFRRLPYFRMLHLLEAPDEQKYALFRLAWENTEDSKIKASAALGMAQVEGASSDWWGRALDLAGEMPDFAQSINAGELDLFSRLAAKYPTVKQVLMERLNNRSISSSIPISEILVKNGIYMESMNFSLEEALESQFQSPIKALQIISHIDSPTSAMIQSIDKLRESNDPEVAPLAAQLYHRFSSRE